MLKKEVTLKHLKKESRQKIYTKLKTMNKIYISTK